MSEYMNAAQHGTVCKDGSEYLDSATECNRLAEENRRIIRRAQKIGALVTKATIAVQELNNFISPFTGSTKVTKD